MKYLTLNPTFGFDTETRIEAVIKNDHSYARAANYTGIIIDGMSHNLFKVTAYLPIANIMMGVVRLALVHKHYGSSDTVFGEINRETAPLLIFRAVSEVLFGPLLAIVDLIKSLVDHHIAKRILASS